MFRASGRSPSAPYGATGTSAAIADRLAVSLGTTKWHVGNVRAKLGATNRTQLLVRAWELGLV